MPLKFGVKARAATQPGNQVAAIQASARLSRIRTNASSWRFDPDVALLETFDELERIEFNIAVRNRKKFRKLRLLVDALKLVGWSILNPDPKRKSEFSVDPDGVAVLPGRNRFEHHGAPLAD